jgi:hypothetical protein
LLAPARGGFFIAPAAGLGIGGRSVAGGGQEALRTAVPMREPPRVVCGQRTVSQTEVDTHCSTEIRAMSHLTPRPLPRCRSLEFDPQRKGESETLPTQKEREKAAKRAGIDLDRKTLACYHNPRRWRKWAIYRQA